MTPETSRSEVLVPLTQPGWVAGLVFVLLAIAALALVTSALWLGVSPGFAYPLAAVPILVHFLSQKGEQKALRGRVLVVSPDKPWQLAFFSEVSGLTDSIEVIVVQRWQHLFGLSLGLKFHHRPHNKSKITLMVVWRQCVSATVFREVSLLAARQIECGDRYSKGNTT